MNYKLPYHDKLLEIRSFLENYYDKFPVKKCQETSKLVSKILGLEEVAGYYGGYDFSQL